MATVDEYWKVLGDPYYATQILQVFDLPKTVEKSQLWLDINATVTQIVLPLILDDKEDVEDHYKVMMLEDNHMGQPTKSFNHKDKLEIDFLMENIAKSSVLNTIFHGLSKSIHVKHGHPTKELCKSITKIIKRSLNFFVSFVLSNTLLKNIRHYEQCPCHNYVSIFGLLFSEVVKLSFGLFSGEAMEADRAIISISEWLS
ncbi:PREDICTED: E3 ubiquitin-ligase [Prunus dulcis]|uniref:PREDICTED: E3 ubiquitin-ligase n=1 Tax=Prunus dulcis TaxID=3755 RepID=A0A5E4F659_PRUDU|nr:hypothetical protein L3X38_009072 [Prunus dulcis]VVA21258.1 PREDICTED: E3 ubiquitin-ligase [Prunus dulcis]